MSDMSETEDGMEVLHFGDGDGEPWKIGASALKTLRGMIIDRDKAWREHAEMAPVIDGAIRKNLKRIDEETFTRIHNFLWHGGLPGTYETRGLDEKQMSQAWREYRLKHYPVRRAAPKPAEEEAISA